MFIVTVCFLFLKPSLYYHGLKILLLTSILVLSAHAYFLRPSLHPRLALSGFSPPSQPFPIRCGNCSFTVRCTRLCSENAYFPEKTATRQPRLGTASLTQTILLMNAFEQSHVLLINARWRMHVQTRRLVASAISGIGILARPHTSVDAGSACSTSPTALLFCAMRDNCKSPTPAGRTKLAAAPEEQRPKPVGEHLRTLCTY